MPGSTARRSWLARLLHPKFGFLRDLFQTVLTSDLFFWAGAITFNVLVAVVPLLLLIVGLSGFLVRARFHEPISDLVDLLMGYLPPVGEDGGMREAVRRVLMRLIDERASLSLIGGLVLLWVSTRLVACVRIVLREIFHADRARGIIHAKLFDLVVVVVGGVLLLLNLVVTVGVTTLQGLGVAFLRLQGALPVLIGNVSSALVALASAWVLFLLVYWGVPLRRIPFRSAAVGATFSAIGYEALKRGFAWYATSVVDYSNTYQSLAVVAVLFFWIYYSAVVFVLGGQVARVHEVRREARMRSAKRESGGPKGMQGLGGRAPVGLAVALSLLAAPGAVSGQAVAPFGGNGNIPGFLKSSEGVVFASSSLDRNMTLDRPLVDTDGRYVIVHVAESRVLVMEGTKVIWSAQAGTGTGFQLEGQGRSWTFTTPVGMFRVLRKEKDPVWVAPDWWYIENGQPIPPDNQRLRDEGTLGTSALFLGDGIAIHGTDRPELIVDPDPEARRVSHGCIRLTNEQARDLYHLVDVGTPVLIF